MSLHRWHPDDRWVYLWQAALPTKAHRAATWPLTLRGTSIGVFLFGLVLGLMGLVR